MSPAPPSLSLADIEAARARIASGIYNSPCPESAPLAEIAGCDVYCKLEYLQRTGSFKERGARNALLLLDASTSQRGVIAASAGNHALGLAYHGQLLGLAVTVVMPQFSPLIKVTTCRRLGANVVLHGESLLESRLHALQLAKAADLTYIHGFNDPHVIAGQGTLGLEILEQVPDAECVIVPVGGGGLIAGVALAIKSQRPDVKVFGVQPERAACFVAARAQGKPVEIGVTPTLADGLAVNLVGDNAFAIARDLVDDVVTVSEEELALAVLRLVELEKSVVEGSGAAPLAACMADKLPATRGKRTVLILSGGNIDPNLLSRVIEKGLVQDHRLCRFTAEVYDRPGTLAHLAKVIADNGCSIKEVHHDRAFAGHDVSSVQILCVVETPDRAQMQKLLEDLPRHGIRMVRSELG
jgi:threonine dehydratase